MAMARHATPPQDGSPTPQPQPLTKRDVRRNRIVEKLQGMIDTFSTNQQSHYRAQLQALQVDMTLVLHSDPYPTGGVDRSGLLEDGGEEIRSMVEGMGANVPKDDEAAQKDFNALAGSWYREYAREVNDCIEKRDAELTALHNHYASSVGELDRLTQHRLRQAEEEHKALTNTIRQRLIANINKKRLQLLRDKEQLDIADSNALLLHPSHFSINNPRSPPNGLQNRKTRYLRHRQGSPNAGDIDTYGKRKRKAGAMEDDGNESPVPTSRSLAPQETVGSRSPFREAREKSVYTQYEAPAYSLERIFTEKELAMATDTAKVATWRYFHQPQQQEQDSNGIVTTVPSIDEDMMDMAEDEDNVGVQPTTEDPDGSEAPGELGAADMERSASHQVLTRGGARANPNAALHDLAALATTSERATTAGTGLATRTHPFAPVVPSNHAVTRSEKSGAPAPSGVSHHDMDNDFALMRQARSRYANANSDVEELPNASVAADIDADEEEQAAHMRRQLLDQALGETSVSQPYRLPLLETGPAIIGRGVERIPGTGFAPVLSFEQKIRQQAAQHPSGTGGAMAAALKVGGEPMSRTTSAGAGSEIGGEVIGPRRGRGRQMV